MIKMFGYFIVRFAKFIDNKVWAFKNFNAFVFLIGSFFILYSFSGALPVKADFAATNVTIIANPPPPPTPPPGGGGGGGGMIILPPETSVIFNGKAYPKSAVTLLKDAQVAATTVAGVDANFQINLTGLTAGNYIFSVYSEDKDGRRSSLLTFPVGVSAGTIVKASGIFIAPTIATDKSEVKLGDNIAIFGQSVPSADITISVNSAEEIFAKSVADKDGVYLYNLDTSALDYGSHSAKSKAALDNQQISGFSSAVSFKVSDRTIIKAADKKTGDVPKADMNSDGRINLVDFSIAAYWYKRSYPPPTADLNMDGKVDLVDFSIMAYYWTG